MCDLTYGDPMPWDPAPRAADGPASGAAGATAVTSDHVDFVVPDTAGTTGVRLEVDWDLGAVDPELCRHNGRWALRLPRPPVDRFEYRFTVRSARETKWITDPGNPATVPNPFGDKSEIRFPEYRRPRWLCGPEGGALQSIPTHTGELATAVPVTLWTPDGLDRATTAPLLIAHDGTDMARRGSLLRWATRAAMERPFRIAMLDPAAGYRDQWYAASESYTDHLAAVVIPAIRSAAAVGSAVGFGISLGALSVLALHRRHPDVLDALALQSGSFFSAALDPQESGYEHFERICAAVSEVSSGLPARTVPVLMTCGAVEENRANNEHMGRVLAAQGFEVDLRVVPDAHTMIGWRDAWSPGLERLLDAIS